MSLIGIRTIALNASVPVRRLTIITTEKVHRFHFLAFEPLVRVAVLLASVGACRSMFDAYDNQKLESLQAAALRLESGKAFDATTNDRTENRIDDGDKVSSFFQEKAKVPGIDDEEGDRQIERKRKNQRELGAWLGGRESLP